MIDSKIPGSDDFHDSARSLAKDSPVTVLDRFCSDHATAVIRLSSDRVSWVVRIEGGVVTYANNSVEPFERMLFHLYQMGQTLPNLTKELFADLRLRFTDVSEDMSGNAGDRRFQTKDYSALCWLVTHQYLTHAQASQIAKTTILESIEPLFWIEEVSYEYTEKTDDSPILCELDLSDIAVQCFQRLALWQLLLPYIWSVYQRPYFFGQTEQQKRLIPEIKLHRKISGILRGFSLRHLATVLKKDELKLAASLVPFISEEMLVLRDPQKPFDLLPKIPSTTPQTFQIYVSQRISAAPSEERIDREEALQLDQSNITNAKAAYKIVCIDDSPTVLAEIRLFLSEDDFELFTFDDPLKAISQMSQIRPDLILLDMMMPQINGYDLCKFLRKNPLLKQTPIVMIIGSSLMERAKANLAGATDFLAKPFSQTELLLKTLSLLG